MPGAAMRDGCQKRRRERVIRPCGAVEYNSKKQP